MGDQGSQFYEFGSFRVDLDHRLLLRDAKPIPLQPKAFEILVVLLKNGEKVVLKDDLLKAVWPDTFVEESNLAQNIFVLRKALGDSVGQNRYIVTVPGRGYRFAEKVQVLPNGEILEQPSSEKLVVHSQLRSRLVVEEQQLSVKALTRLGNVGKWALAAVVGSVLTAALLLIHRTPRLTSRDTVVLADFVNSTGDPVFDATLRQGLSAQLEQSPFLNLASDQRTAQTLGRMGLSKDTRLTPDVAREVCQRSAGTAVFEGSIAQLGARYLLTLKALDCSTGETLASSQAEANDKDHVVDALGTVASAMRRKLGESLVSVQKYDVPPQDVTTPSLEALHSYSLAMKTRHGDMVIPIQLFQRAIEQDPNFAMAYAQLGVLYINLNETGKGADNLRKAYALRNRVSERERFYIAAHYDEFVTGDLTAARNDYELWMNIYPRDHSPVSSLAAVYFRLGDFNKVLDFSRRGLALNGVRDKPLQPEINEIWSDIMLNRLDEAKSLALGAQTNHVDDPMFHLALYMIDFLNRDPEAMKREVDLLASNPTWGDGVLGYEADTAGYGGQLARARDFTRRASTAAINAGKKQTAAAYEAEAAIREALLGNREEAKQEIKKALELSRAKDIIAMSGLAASLAGDSAQATQLAKDLNESFPQDTVIQVNYLPTIHASLEVHGQNPAKAVELLAPAAPYESGVTALDAGLSFYPVYVRGEAYLAAKRGPAALAEFKKILDHSGIVQNEPIGALAQLGLGRAYALTADNQRSLAAYRDFFELWKNADPNVPLLKQAMAEYAKLQ
jgi:DNA-binding winged helix-turn-helix (wHTH) protein/tetratricopeptide (TPR) repeat protein